MTSPQPRPHHRSARSLIALAGSGLAIGLALAGCGVPKFDPSAGRSSASSSAPAPTDLADAAAHVTQWDANKMPDPCRTLTSAEVGRIVGGPTKPGTKLNSWPPLCQYAIGSGGQIVFVSDNPLATGAQEYKELQNSGQKTVPVTGLGDQAYWVPELDTLHVMIGQTHLKVLFSGSSIPAPDVAKPEALELARTAIGRL